MLCGSLASTSFTLMKEYGRVLSFDNHNIYSDSDLIIDDNEIQSLCEVTYPDTVFDEINSKKYNYEEADVEEKCLAKFRDCINKKYGDDYLDQYSYYYNDNLFGSVFKKEELSSEYRLRFSVTGVDKKAYFSSKLKKGLEYSHEENLVM